ncbi:hypothetical protein Cal6303_3016 [Calothrix sp. PCC 6303]|nr:hypothetical protein Cal6303_3016 [Calothrix sp. PCC 6303]
MESEGNTNLKMIATHEPHPLPRLWGWGVHTSQKNSNLFFKAPLKPGATRTKPAKAGLN